MHPLITLVPAVSVVCQFAAAVLALRLTRITGHNRSWLLIASAFGLMALRRMIVAYGIFQGEPQTRLDITAEAVGLIISSLLLLGIAAIGPLFASICKAAKVTECSRVELERQIVTRTHELGNLLAMYERDRKLIAFEIHDGFVQQATGALMSLQGYRSVLATDPAQAGPVLAQSIEMLERGIAEARHLIGGLRPVVLDEAGLIPAVDQLVAESRTRSGIDIQWTHEVKFDRLPAPLETGIFRIIQESLNNALRHSGSPRVGVTVTQVGDRVRVTVRDWGRGFDVTKVGPDHYGVEGIQERARLLGGEAKIESNAGQGTCVTAELPIG